ncbi:tetratricopeptide repeat-containing sensor histidine kinase [Flavobacterium microcysteis]|uniref:Tetratricopeptide repeat protein n=1 Tax=Flavobacterium microcysteis TaxID=2596891 RepID=A0A501Q7G4_9FLAO|nr:tetratricopeptide repeat protein [Flavobacterium microcysteis]TPD68603.1 tetratricopeptide repeat protein [Flavobacterium microcysteis]
MSRITKSALFLLLLFTFSVSYSQDRVIDSIKILIRNPKLHDTTKLRAISDAMDYHYMEQEKNYYVLNNMMGKIALENYKKSNTPELKEKYTLWLASYYSTVGTEYSFTKEREKGLVYHDKSIALFKSIKYYDEMYKNMLVKAALYVRMNQDHKAIPLIFDAVKYFEKDKEYYVDDLAYAYSGLGQIYIGQKQHQKAISYNQKAIRFYEDSYAQEPNDHTSYLKSLAYSNIAYSYSSLKKFEESIEYCNKALQITRKIKNYTITGLVLSRLGNAKMHLGKLDEAEKIFNEIFSIKGLAEATNDAALSSAYYGLADLHVKKGDLNKAELYADKGFQLSKKTGSIDLQDYGAKLIYDISKATKNFEKALEMYQFHEKIVDSSQIQASKNELEQQLLKYDFEKKELNYKLAAQKKAEVKNNWLMGLSGVLFFLLIGGYFYYRNTKQKQEITKLEKNQIKQKLLITQMNPHFIFNSISNIQGLIREKKEEESISYLNKFSVLTRQILENSNENYISLEEEVGMMENYLSIQQLLYSNKFSFTLVVDEAIDQESLFLPPMLTQPFIENAIKHGLADKDQNGKIDIRFYLKESKLFFEIFDNGKGFDAPKAISNHKSLAMTITKERLISYTKNQDFVVQTDTIKDKDEKVLGAKVVFEIPYIYEG